MIPISFPNDSFVFFFLLTPSWFSCAIELCVCDSELNRELMHRLVRFNQLEMFDGKKDIKRTLFRIGKLIAVMASHLHIELAPTATSMSVAVKRFNKGEENGAK